MQISVPVTSVVCNKYLSLWKSWLDQLMSFEAGYGKGQDCQKEFAGK